MLGSNPEQLRHRYYLSDALSTWLKLIHRKYALWTKVFFKPVPHSYYMLYPPPPPNVHFIKVFNRVITMFLTLACTPLASHTLYLCYFKCLFHTVGVLRLCYFTCLFHFLSVTFHESFVTVRKAKQGPPQAAKERMPSSKNQARGFSSCLVINRPGGQGEGGGIK